jgi:RNA-directed DNA polymerase
MSLGEARHQKPGKPGRAVARRGEAASEAASDEAALAQHAQTDWGASDLLGQALARENMAAAWKHVKANKGSAGVDGRTVQDTGEYLKSAWPDIGCSTAATGPIRCAVWASPSRAAGCASWGYQPSWTG